jgi:hypothetical protein
MQYSDILGVARNIIECDRKLYDVDDSSTASELYDASEKAIKDTKCVYTCRTTNAANAKLAVTNAIMHSM